MAQNPYSLGDVNLCSLVEGEVRVWAWSHGDAVAMNMLLTHAAWLKKQGELVWIDRYSARAVGEIQQRRLDFMPRSVQYRQMNEAELAEQVRVEREARRQADQAAARAARTHSNERRPAIGTHIAGQIVDGDQVCARCKAVLKCHHEFERPSWTSGGPAYVPGALVARGPGWQGYALLSDNAKVTCEPA